MVAESAILSDSFTSSPVPSSTNRSCIRPGQSPRRLRRSRDWRSTAGLGRSNAAFPGRIFRSDTDPHCLALVRSHLEGLVGPDRVQPHGLANLHGGHQSQSCVIGIQSGLGARLLQRAERHRDTPQVFDPRPNGPTTLKSDNSPSRGGRLNPVLESPDSSVRSRNPISCCPQLAPRRSRDFNQRAQRAEGMLRLVDRASTERGASVERAPSPSDPLTPGPEVIPTPNRIPYHSNNLPWRLRAKPNRMSPPPTAVHL